MKCLMSEHETIHSVNLSRILKKDNSSHKNWQKLLIEWPPSLEEKDDTIYTCSICNQVKTGGSYPIIKKIEFIGKDGEPITPRTARRLAEYGCPQCVSKINSVQMSPRGSTSEKILYSPRRGSGSYSPIPSPRGSPRVAIELKADKVHRRRSSGERGGRRGSYHVIRAATDNGMTTPLTGSPARSLPRTNSGLRRSQTINPEETKAHLEVLKKLREKGEKSNHLSEKSL